MPYLGICGLKFKKTIVIFEMSTLKFVKNESLTHTVNFGVGSAFSKVPGSAFSEGPGLGPGLFSVDVGKHSTRIYNSSMYCNIVTL